MEDQEISVFDIYEYLPHSNCKNCGENNCMAFAQKLLDGSKTIGGCAPLREPILAEKRQKILELINQL